MARLGRRDLQRALEGVRALYATRTLDAFPRHVLGILMAAVPCEFSSYNQVDHRRRRIAWIVEPADALVPDLEPVFARHMQEHPFITHYARTGEGRARKISDFLTPRQFHRLALYHEVYRRTGVEHQIALAVPAAPGALIIGIDRGHDTSDFSERERRVLDLLRPHLMQAYGNACALSQTQRDLAIVGQAAGALHRGIVMLRRDGRLLFANEEAHRLLARYFPGVSGRVGPLPEPLSAWLRYQEALLAVEDDVPDPRQPFVMARDPGRLVVRLLSDPDAWVLLLEEETTGIPAGRLTSLGLTAREAQVLAWVARGKTNAETAQILGASPKTIGKHLERIYERLGVESRTAAVVRAFEVTGESGADKSSSNNRSRRRSIVARTEPTRRRSRDSRAGSTLPHASAVARAPVEARPPSGARGPRP